MNIYTIVFLVLWFAFTAYIGHDTTVRSLYKRPREMQQKNDILDGAFAIKICIKGNSKKIVFPTLDAFSKGLILMTAAQVYGLLAGVVYIGYIEILEKMTASKILQDYQFNWDLVHVFSLVGAFGFYYGRSSVLRFFWIQTSMLYREADSEEADSAALISKFKTLE